MGSWRVIILMVLGALVASGCGETESHPRQQAAGDGGSTAGSGAIAGGGSPVAVTGGASGFAGVGGLAGAGAPPAHPLITGDDACPPSAPTGDGCTELGVSCVYRGIASGLSESALPFRCACMGGAWACVQSDENGDTACPIVTLPGPADACPPSAAQPCVYPLFAQHAMASCYCPPSSGSGGVNGTGGSIWRCGF